jgi:predicted dienelactone hydrolase
MVTRSWCRPVLAAVLVLVSYAPLRAQDAELYKSQPGPWGLKQVDETWHDAARSRDVPVRIYLPQARASESEKKGDGDAKGPEPKTTPEEKHPVIVFSHGLGASRTAYAYFGRHMASWGYIVVAPTHAGSDTAALEDWIKTHGGIGPDRSKPGVQDGWLKSSIQDPANLTNRPLDISFVIDQLSKDAELKDVADTTRIGMAGHSFGADTSMQIGGMTTELPDSKGKSFREPRVKAVLPMSPEGPGAMGIMPGAWDSFAAPVLFLTGTRDYGAGARSADWRRAGFEHVKGVDDYLVTLNGAGHMTFGGAGAGGGGPMSREQPLDVVPEDPKPVDPANRREPIRERVRERMSERRAESDGAHHVKMIDSLSVAFFDAYLRDDAKAREWLRAFMATKHDDCTAEMKAGAEKK